MPPNIILRPLKKITYFILIVSYIDDYLSIKALSALLLMIPDHKKKAASLDSLINFVPVRVITL